MTTWTGRLVFSPQRTLFPYRVESGLSVSVYGFLDFVNVGEIMLSFCASLISKFFCCKMIMSNLSLNAFSSSSVLFTHTGHNMASCGVRRPASVVHSARHRACEVVAGRPVKGILSLKPTILMGAAFRWSARHKDCARLQQNPFPFLSCAHNGWIRRNV